MKIHGLYTDPNFKSYTFKDEQTHERLRGRLNKQLIENWISLELETNYEGAVPDFVGIHWKLYAVSEKGKNQLEQLIPKEELQFLPVFSPDGPYYLLNLLQVVDGLDYVNSKLSRLPSGKISRIEALTVYPDKISQYSIFKLLSEEGDQASDDLYISDRLAEGIKDLSGTQIIELWDSECSWQQRELNYERQVQSINASLKNSFSYSKAISLIEKKDMIVYSGHWALKHSKKKGILIGNLCNDGTYSWLDPAFIPPILFQLQWGTLEEEEEQSVWQKIKSMFG
ncbi:imm11 family protein [Paenibacillus paridis]|uniref:imm11 family protein n=1 Tax=Paenibacillus paridis TaxID=2583376 RepID=UPI00111FC0A6|nr:DUF1629 domain-containing protein [Paenibacillus paridis]